MFLITCGWCGTTLDVSSNPTLSAIRLRSPSTSCVESPPPPPTDAPASEPPASTEPTSGSGSAAACTGSDANRDFYADADFTRYGLDEAAVTALRAWAQHWSDDIAERLLEEGASPDTETGMEDEQGGDG